MIGNVEDPRAWWLTYGMARSIGVNLPRAVLDGRLTRKDLAAMVGRCQRCGRSDDCTLWLAKPGAGVPEFCKIKSEIEALAPDL